MLEWTLIVCLSVFLYVCVCVRQLYSLNDLVFPWEKEGDGLVIAGRGPRGVRAPTPIPPPPLCLPNFDHISHKWSPGHGPVSFFSGFGYLNLMTSWRPFCLFRMRHSHGRNFDPTLFKYVKML